MNIIDMRLDQESVIKMNQDQFQKMKKLQSLSVMQNRREKNIRTSKSLDIDINTLEKMKVPNKGHKYYKDLGSIDIELNWDTVGTDFKALNASPLKITDKLSLGDK